MNKFHVLLACYKLLLVLLLQMFEDLVPPYLILILAFLELSLFFGFELSKSLCRLFLIFMHFLQPALSFHDFFAGEVHFDTLDFLVDRLFIVLTTRLDLLFEELLGRFLNLFKVIVEVSV